MNCLAQLSAVLGGVFFLTLFIDWVYTRDEHDPIRCVGEGFAWGVIPSILAYVIHLAATPY